MILCDTMPPTSRTAHSLSKISITPIERNQGPQRTLITGWNTGEVKCRQRTVQMTIWRLDGCILLKRYGKISWKLGVEVERTPWSAWWSQNLCRMDSWSLRTSFLKREGDVTVLITTLAATLLVTYHFWIIVTLDHVMGWHTRDI